MVELNHEPVKRRAPVHSDAVLGKSCPLIFNLNHGHRYCDGAKIRCYGKHRRPIHDYRPRGGRFRARAVPTTTALTDSQLVDLQKTTSAHQRQLDAIKTAAAGELARRSRRELGHAGLAAREGFRSPEAMLQSITGATGREASQLVTLGKISTEADAARQLLDDGVEDIGGEPVALPWETPITTALSQRVLSAEQADAVRRGLGVPTEQVSAEVLRADRRRPDRRPRRTCGGSTVQGSPHLPGSDR